MYGNGMVNVDLYSAIITKVSNTLYVCMYVCALYVPIFDVIAIAHWDGSVAEWLACWTPAQKGLGSNRSRDAVG